jgi:hypothetical protein
MRVQSFGDYGIVHAKNNYSYEISGQDRSEIEDAYKSRFNKLTWEDMPLTVGQFKVIPFGFDNQLPIEIRETIGKHNLAPRIFTKRKFLTWGNGPILYTLKLEGGKIVKEYIEDKEVLNWLKSWNYERYLQAAIEDFNHTEGHFTKVQMAKSFRLGKPFISSLEHLSVNICRLGYRLLDQEEKPTHVLVGKWHKMSWKDYKAYHLLDKSNPTEHRTSVSYDNLYSFATDSYSQPDVVGSLPWIRRSIAIPVILQALSENSLHIKWHVISPAKYWDEMRSRMQQECSLKGQLYNEQMLEDRKEEIFGQLSEMLSGEVNVGKFWASEKVIEVIGTTVAEHKWELIPMDQKIKDFVDAQLAIASAANFQTIAGLGLHQALANIAAEGKSDSGSEQLYALKNYMLTEVALPETIITQTLNQAIAINWPNKNIKVGFWRDMPEREQDVTSKDRITNANTI